MNLETGDVFEAQSEKDAKLLTLIKKAKAYEAETEERNEELESVDDEAAKKRRERRAARKGFYNRRDLRSE